MSFKFKDNTKKIFKELEKAKQEALKEIAITVEKQAVLLVPVRSGDLRKSIDHKIDNNFAYVGVLSKGPGADYAVLIEIGDKYRKAQPYISEAFKSSENEIKKLIKEYYKKVGEK